MSIVNAQLRNPDLLAQQGLLLCQRKWRRPGPEDGASLPRKIAQYAHAEVTTHAAQTTTY